MVDLSIDFAGLTLKNPFIIASSELTNKVEKIKLAEENGASGADEVDFPQGATLRTALSHHREGGRLLLAVR